MPFITTFNPSSPNIYSTIKSSANCLNDNNVSGFHNIRLIQNKCQSPSLKKLLTKAKFGEVLLGTFNCSDKRYECCNYLLINDHYTFKNVQITFTLKNHFTCNSFNLIYVVCVCVFILFHLLVSFGCTTSLTYVRSSDQQSFVVSILGASTKFLHLYF